MRRKIDDQTLAPFSSVSCDIIFKKLYDYGLIKVEFGVVYKLIDL
jgi:hypothetical protein